MQIHKQAVNSLYFQPKINRCHRKPPRHRRNRKTETFKQTTAIVEGEVIALDTAGYPIAFQHLMRRFKRIREIAGMTKKIPLTLYLFDILFLNGESLIAKALHRTQANLSPNRRKNRFNQPNRHRPASSS